MVVAFGSLAFVAQVPHKVSPLQVVHLVHADPMTTYSHMGGCHCSKLRWNLETELSVTKLTPRACDCDFCIRHHAAWISDPKGTLTLYVLQTGVLQRYRQGSEQAEFIICRNCGVLVAVVATDTRGTLLGAANRNAFDQREDFPAEAVVSPQRLLAEQKLARWSEVWTPTRIHVS